MNKIYALIKNNIIINTVLLDENATEELINEIKSSNNAELAIDTTTYEDFGIGYTWHSDHFRPEQPYPSWIWDGEKWTAPSDKPTDAIYTWNEDSQSWIFVESFLIPEEI